MNGKSNYKLTPKILTMKHKYFKRIIYILYINIKTKSKSLRDNIILLTAILITFFVIYNLRFARFLKRMKIII